MVASDGNERSVFPQFNRRLGRDGCEIRRAFERGTAETFLERLQQNAFCACEKPSLVTFETEQPERSASIASEPNASAGSVMQSNRHRPFRFIEASRQSVRW